MGVDRILAALKPFLDVVEPRAGGGNGYTSSFKLNDGALLLWSDDSAKDWRLMGVHLSIPGGNIANWLSVDDTERGLLAYLTATMDGKCTRLDIAYDDFGGYLHMDIISEYSEARHLSTRWQNVSYTRHDRTSSGDPAGRIIRSGKRSSDTYCRVYDKRLEMLDRTGKCEYGHWVRVELEVKGPQAVFLAAQAVKGDVEELCGYLLKLLNFKEPAGDTNKRRWRTAPWWLGFLHGAAKCTLTLASPDRSVDKTAAWIDHQVKASLAMLVLAISDGDRWRGEAYVRRLVAEGTELLNDEHRRMLKRYSQEAQRRKKHLIGAT